MYVLLMVLIFSIHLNFSFSSNFEEKQRSKVEQGKKMMTRVRRRKEFCVGSKQ